MEGRAEAAIVAVPLDAVRELEREGLAIPQPALRGAVLDAVVTVGTDSAALVTLLQAPDSVREFATWVRDRCARSGDSIELRARRGRLRVRLRVDGDVDVDTVADFLLQPSRTVARSLHRTRRRSQQETVACTAPKSAVNV